MLENSVFYYMLMMMILEVQKLLLEFLRFWGDFLEEEEEEEIDVVDGIDFIVGFVEILGIKYFIKFFYFRKKVICKICFLEKNFFN